MRKHQVLLQYEEVSRIGFLCRLINLLEDIVEDAECRDILVTTDLYESRAIYVKPLECRYDTEESISLFKMQHDIEDIFVDRSIQGSSYTRLYDELIEYYAKKVHHIILRYTEITDKTNIEYFLGILLNGEGFLVEGEEDQVILPSLPLCISAHTHPRGVYTPSLHDIKMIIRTLLDRGIGHAIVTSSGSQVIYRRRPLTLDDYLYLRSLENTRDPGFILYKMTERGVAVVKRI